MPVIQSKITRHKKRQENTTHNEDEAQSIEIRTETRQNTEFVGKYIEIAINDMVHIVRKVEGISMLRRYMDNIKKTPNKPVQIKATMSEKKNTR